ncbi:GspE/PulE family protein [Vibrio agarivorans]|uniref:GspE/PulE family protein n=1 Tax=Vibrio agarivorans TaxID=153622 RepID=UPI0025B2B178|nr:ATPase, T2SS/T4P/T4SS family [Vibrio agarivorans]MDN3661084.1 ATPase, T2SS/T4P/T4SS family [Vibrio agarivorans]
MTDSMKQLDLEDSTITSLNQLGSIGGIVRSEELGLGDKYHQNYILIVSKEHKVQVNKDNANTKTDAVFLLVDERISKGQSPINTEEYREHVRCVRRYTDTHYGIRPQITYASTDIILNALKNSLSNSNNEHRNKTEIEIDELLLKAHELNASDVHIVCSDTVGETRIKFRQDGELLMYGHERNQDSIHDLASVLYSSLAAEDGAIKDASFDSLTKQDGVIYRTVGSLRLGARIASHPTEKKDKNFVMVLRMLGDQYETATKIPFNQLGFEFNQAAKIAQCLYGKGIVLIIGETNSGKSVTMANMMMEIDEESNHTRHIVSFENPIERQINGVNQINLIDSGASSNSTLDDSFKAAMEFIVRADPDDVAVGEVRDKSTCSSSQQLALTGHNVLATMHCDSPFDVMERMIGLGASERQLKSGETMKAVVSQKLFKKLCPHCSQTIFEQTNLTALQQAAVKQLAEMGLSHKLDVVKFRNEAGCDKCDYRGIKGRRLVAEIVEYTIPILQALAADNKDEAKRLWLNDSGFSRKDVALFCIFQGLIDPTNVIEQLSDLNETYHLREQFDIQHPAEIYG